MIDILDESSPSRFSIPQPARKEYLLRCMQTTILSTFGTASSPVEAYEQQQGSVADSLAKLREDLRHFDESRHMVDGANVTEIKSILLLRRIAELEAAMQRTRELAAAATLEQP